MVSLQLYLKKDSSGKKEQVFFVNFAKFLRTPFLQNTSRRLLRFVQYGLAFSKHHRIH